MYKSKEPKQMAFQCLLRVFLRSFEASGQPGHLRRWLAVRPPFARRWLAVGSPLNRRWFAVGSPFTRRWLAVGSAGANLRGVPVIP